MLKKLALVTALAATCYVVPASADVVTNVYSGHSDTGGGEPYSNLIGTLFTPGISFATDTGYNWHPFGLGDFGADSMATLHVPTSGTYTFHLSSDDGALVYIDGSLLIDRGGPHGPSTSDGTLFLSAGPHSLEVQFFECCGGRSGVDFSIPLGVTATTPLPAALPLMGSVLGGGFLVSLFRRRREKKAA
jgi:hypothetical protein